MFSFFSSPLSKFSYLTTISTPVDTEEQVKPTVAEVAKAVEVLNEKIDSSVQETLTALGSNGASVLADYLSTVDTGSAVVNKALICLALSHTATMAKVMEFAKTDRVMSVEDAVKTFSNSTPLRTEDTQSNVMTGEQVQAAAGAYVPGSGQFPEAKVDSTTLEVHATFEKPGQEKITQIVYSSDRPNATVEELQTSTGQAGQVVDSVVKSTDPAEDTAIGYALRNASKGNQKRSNAPRG